MSVAFQICSDLHTEFHKKINLKHFLRPVADNLIIAGDLGHPSVETYHSFLQQASTHFQHVFLIAGNHEFYGETLQSGIQRIRDVVNRIERVTFLDNESFRFEEQNITLLGTTLWSDITSSECNKVMNSLSDYIEIYRKDSSTIHAGELKALFDINKNWLESELTRRKNEKVIVITHHMPSYHLIPPDYKNCGYNSAFASHLDAMICDPVKLWICGHSHLYRNMTINNINVILNPRGYPSEYTGFKLDLKIEID